MPSKRTRSAAVEQPDGNSSNVTDYMGPPKTKRKKSKIQYAKPSLAVAKRAEAAIKSAERLQSKAVSTHHNSTQQDVEEDDDNGSIHVDLTQVSLAVNEARSGRTRSINGLQPKVQEAVRNGVTEDEDEEENGERPGGEGQDEQKQDEDVDGEEAALSVRKRGRPGKKKQTRQQDRPETLSRAEVIGSTGDVYDWKPTSRQEIQSRKQEASAHNNSSGKSAPKQIRQQQQESAKERAAPGGGERQENDESLSEDGEPEEDMQGTVTQTAEDSAFIDAPRLHEKLPEVKCTVKTLRGMILTLSHPAWTGRKGWDEDPEMACSTKTSGELIELLRQLNDLLRDSCEARYEGDADGDPEVTIGYLRRNSRKIKALFAEITSLVDLICTQKLAAGDKVEPRGVKTRKRFLRDITKRLMPMLVLVLQKAYDVGPSEEKGGVVHLTINSFTIQFPLRTIGWATRLMEALSRGLLQWPIDAEFDQSDEELDIADAAQKQAKISKREMFRKHLALLYLVFKRAADALERQAKEGEKKTRQEQYRQRALAEEEQYRRQAMIRGRELWAKNERERQEAQRKATLQMERFVQASQALGSMPDPLAVLWSEAGLLLHTPEPSQVAVSNSPVSLRRPPKGTARGSPQFEDDLDFFSNNKGGPSGHPVQRDRASNYQPPRNGLPRTINGLQPARAFEAWGAPRWSKAEEKRLVLGFKFDKTYNPSTFAPRLGRSAEDVASKAAELKAVYRAIYTRRGTSIPTWAW